MASSSQGYTSHMMKSVFVLAALGMATHVPEWFLQKLKTADLSDEYNSCNSYLCEQPLRKYKKMLPMQPGVQWMPHGGYCGAWSIQRSVLAKGAYISQQQVRDHAKSGGGHDDEILNTNIDGAFKKLRIQAEDFEFNLLPTPQSDEYLKFMKKQLVAENPVIWMVMFSGSTYPSPGYSMDNLTNGMYGHIEPVVGIMSNHELTDETVYEDDVFAYFDDASKLTYYVAVSDVSGQCTLGRFGKQCEASCPNSADQCVWDQRGYMYAVQDFTDQSNALPVSLSIHPFASEPYTRGGQKPIEITGTLTISNLVPEMQYDIYRWDSVEDAFVYSDVQKIKTFTATKDHYSFEDPKKFLSNSTTYYRCVPASSGVVV